MTKIFIEGQQVDLTVGGMSFTLERYNPLFDFAEIRGTKTNDFSLPNTPKNRRVFGYYDNPQFGNIYRTYSCVKEVDGRVIERGFVALKEASTEAFTLFYTQNLGEIFLDNQDTLLTRLPFGEELIPVLDPNPPLATAKFVFPQIINAGFYGTNVQAGWNGYMNEYTSEAYNEHARVPMFFVHWVLNKAAELCNFTFKGTFMDDTAMKRLIFYNTFSLDDATTIHYANHLPELTLRVLLKELRLLFNLYLDFDVSRRILTIDFADPIMGLPASRNWTDKASPKHVRTPELNNRLELDWSLDGGDELMKVIPLGFEKYQTPDNGGGRLFSLKTQLSTLMTDPSGLAITKQAGITPRFNQLNQRFAPRLLFWNGLVAGKPTATQAYGGYRLAWSGTNNLRDTCWGNYEAWRGRTFQLKKDILLTASDLAALDFRQKYHIKGVDYYLDSTRTNIPLKGPSQIVLWRG